MTLLSLNKLLSSLLASCLSDFVGVRDETRGTAAAVARKPAPAKFDFRYEPTNEHAFVLVVSRSEPDSSVVSSSSMGFSGSGSGSCSRSSARDASASGASACKEERLRVCQRRPGLIKLGLILGDGMMIVMLVEAACEEDGARQSYPYLQSVACVLSIEQSLYEGESP